MAGTDLSILYKLRENFTIVALTGRIGSGCNDVALQLGRGFDGGKNFPNATELPLTHNSYRKYRIVYNYAKQNFTPFKRISYRDVLTLFILKNGFDTFIEYLSSYPLNQSFSNSGLKVICDFREEIAGLEVLRTKFDDFRNKVLKINLQDLKSKQDLKALHSLFFGNNFKKFSDDFHSILRKKSKTKGIKTLQIIANNLRKSGNSYNYHITDAKNIFSIAELINDLIKAYRSQKKGESKIVIDPLRNPLEIMFFKQRFAAFYLIVVSRDEKAREKQIEKRYGTDHNDIKRIAEEEYKIAKGSDFYKPFVRDCIEKADIHIS
jgi:hypothetical protein